MVTRRLIVLFMVIGVLVSACGNSISADTCDELADETIDMVQRLIDDVDAASGELTIEDIIASDGDLPSLEKYQEDSARIDELADELGCSRTKLREDVAARASELHAESDLGRFIVSAIRAGGI